MDTILSVSHVSKSYGTADHRLKVLDDIHFEIHAGDTVAIIGPSGSGKTTLLGLCAGLDRPTEGSIRLNGIPLESLDEDQRARVRNQHIGFVFQNFQLLPTLTALENVMVPMELQGLKNIRSHAMDLLAKVGLANRQDHYPVQLSGGEQQRVSIARAFSNQPRILFADEPTGNLDAENSELIERLLFELNREAGTTLVVVTHNPELAAKTGRIIALKGGKVISDLNTASEKTSH
jgi:putative ABC transport system ATP-binding protein